MKQSPKHYLRVRLTTGWAVAAIILGMLDRFDCAAASTDDHLVPAEEFLADKARAEYRKLWQQKLLVTPGDVARFIGLPGTFGEETAVSLYHAPTKAGGMPGEYWVTATQATKSLWNHLRQSGEKPGTDARGIRIERCDAPVPESTARAVRQVWLVLLQQTRSEPDSGFIGLDGSTEIVSATSSTGAALRARVPDEPGPNTLTIVNIANLLMRYCDVPESERPELARNIEKAASKLLAQTKPAK